MWHWDISGDAVCTQAQCMGQGLRGAEEVRGRSCGHPEGHAPHSSPRTLAPCPGRAGRPPLGLMVPCLPCPTHREGSLGGWSNAKAALKRDGHPSPPSRGTGRPPGRRATQQSPAWPLGPADPSSIPPGLGESPQPAHCPTPATFPLPHCSRYQHPTRSAAAQESVAAAEAAAEAG